MEMTFLVSFLLIVCLHDWWKNVSMVLVLFAMGEKKKQKRTYKKIKKILKLFDTLQLKEQSKFLFSIFVLFLFQSILKLIILLI